MGLIAQPPNNQVVDGDGNATPGYQPFFSTTFNLLNALTMSGTTAKRPTALLYAGRPYWDTTLGIPIWLKSVGPIVWVDATGAPV